MTLAAGVSLAQAYGANWRRLPVGALLAVVLVTLTHLLAAYWIVPAPVAREHARRKVLALTDESRPVLIVAGDSRARCGIDPLVIAGHLGLAAPQTANIAEEGCDLSTVWALYHEFSSRFETSPVMVVNVSPFSINDGIRGRMEAGELLWSLSFTERTQLVSISHALTSLFLPEKALSERLAVKDQLLQLEGRGYWSSSKIFRSNDAGMAMRINAYREGWFARPELDGICYRMAEQTLVSLHRMGVQIVVLDLPFHPALTRAMAETRDGEILDLFHEQIRSLCTRLKLPLFRYLLEDVSQGDPEEYFRDLVHLNRAGAARVSNRLGEDLSRLIREGRLHLPG